MPIIIISAIFFAIFAYIFKNVKHPKIMLFPFSIYLLIVFILFVYNLLDFTNNFSVNIISALSYIAVLIAWIFIPFIIHKIKCHKKYADIKYYSSAFILFSVLIFTTTIFWWLPVLHDMDSSFFRSTYSDGFEVLVLIVLFALLLIYYIFIYWFYNYFNKKNKLRLGEKYYFILRNFTIIFSALIIYFSIIDISIIYSKYYEWFKSPENFSGQTYTCIDKNTKLILEKNYKHHPIVNPYDNFIDFYKNYWVSSPNYPMVITNRLSPELINWDFLKSCINEKWENYYDNYFITHWVKPVYIQDMWYSSWYNDIPSHSTEEIKNIYKLLNK